MRKATKSGHKQVGFWKLQEKMQVVWVEFDFSLLGLSDEHSEMLAIVSHAKVNKIDSGLPALAEGAHGIQESFGFDKLLMQGGLAQGNTTNIKYIPSMDSGWVTQDSG